MSKGIVKVLLAALLLVMGGISWANAEETAADKLSAESTEYVKSTEKDAVTPQLIIEKVEAAAKLIAKEGDAAFSKFKGKGSDFLFSGTYIWIHDMTGKMLMHPIKHKMEGKALLNLKDKNGKLFFVEMNKIAKEDGAGWVEYVWPKPGETEVSPKISYVKLATKGKKEYIIGCGVYDLTIDQVKKALEKK